MERFHDVDVDELVAFPDLAESGIETPCPPRRRLVLSEVAPARDLGRCQVPTMAMVEGRGDHDWRPPRGAPSSWGVCEVPGCGRQLDPVAVLSQMQEVGLVATELGTEREVEKRMSEQRKNMDEATGSPSGHVAAELVHGGA